MPERPRRLPKLLAEPMWVLGLVVLVDEVDKNIVRGLIDPLKTEFGVGDFAIGVLLSMQLLFNGIITVPAGYLADRWNRTRAIGTTVIAWSALTAAGAGAFGFVMLVGLRSVLGFGQAVSEPSGASLLGDYYPPEKRGKAFSIQMAMLFVGTGIGVALGGWLGLTLGWRWALVIVALPGLLVA
ncbi:MAG: MFS transporter, partial [Acidimicrobiales bacterium]